jgi:hypothetical protein
MFLPGLPQDLIRACYAAAPGNETESGKFSSPVSSAALAANAFGLFLVSPGDFPPPPGGETWGWPASAVRLETELRFPWRGGCHPWVYVLVETSTALIGIESKRYEPFSREPDVSFSDAYWRPVWGNAMAGYERVRDNLRDNHALFTRLDAAQLVKHAFGLRTRVHRKEQWRGKRPVLVYVYAEPERWPDGRPIRAEVGRFAETVADDEVLSMRARIANSCWLGPAPRTTASAPMQSRLHSTSRHRPFSYRPSSNPWAATPIAGWSSAPNCVLSCDDTRHRLA